MARPLLADPDLPRKAAEGREDEINTCIACNQGCLDRVFEDKRATCLVNPRAAYETELCIAPARAPKRVAVVGAGPAGLACATALAERGHRVTLFERAHEIGGQFRYAREVPGKEDFHDTLRYFARRIELTGVDAAAQHRRRCARPRWRGLRRVRDVERRRGARAGDSRHRSSEGHLLSRSAVGRAPGGRARRHHRRRRHRLRRGDVPHAPTRERSDYFAEWGIDRTLTQRGGLRAAAAGGVAAPRLSTAAQGRRLGATLGKTTGWIHRTALKHARRGDAQRREYERIDDAGLHIATERGRGSAGGRTSIICAGQESVNELATRARRRGKPVHVIGGALLAAELDAERAIREGVTLAARI